SHGAALSGAHVAVTSKGVNRMTTTDGSGHFSIGGLPDGTYTVIAAHAGYQTRTTSVTIKGGATRSIRLALVPKPLEKQGKLESKKAEAADVAAEAPVMAKPAPPARVRMSAPAPSGAIALHQQPEMNTEAYARIDDNPYFRTDAKPLSTFSADVDTASYAN